MYEVKELRLIPVEDDQRQLWNTLIVFMAVISSDVRDRSHASREESQLGQRSRGVRHCLGRLFPVDSTYPVPPADCVDYS